MRGGFGAARGADEKGGGVGLTGAAIRGKERECV